MDGRLLSDKQLLELEIDTLWSRNGNGRLVRDRGLKGSAAPRLVIASSRDATVAAFGDEVPETVAREISGLLPATSIPWLDSPPAPLQEIETRLTVALGPVEVASGPTYVAGSVATVTSPATIISSERWDRQVQRLSAPARANWAPEEWMLLLDGALGPWAAAAVEGDVIALCFSARLTDHAAEAGVWTDPDHRGRGHAAAVTAAWASQVRPTGRVVFYSTSAENRSSQQVAARLGLRPVGWMWHFLGVGRGR
jgi:RimJ/RimL family protein N-acetyltransferase